MFGDLQKARTNQIYKVCGHGCSLRYQAYVSQRVQMCDRCITYKQEPEKFDNSSNKNVVRININIYTHKLLNLDIDNGKL